MLIDGRMAVDTLTLTSFDPGMLIFCDPPTFRAQAGRPSASYCQAHPNVALGDRAWPRVIVPCHPALVCHQEIDGADRSRANGGSANLSTPGSIPMSVEAISFQAVAKAAGVKLKLDKVQGKPTVYRAV